MLRARSPRVVAVPGSPPGPIASSGNSVICVVSICRCRAEDSALRQCRNTLSNQAGFLLALPRRPTIGDLSYSRLELFDGLIGHLELGFVATDREAQERAIPRVIHRALSRIHCEPQ